MVLGAVVEAVAWACSHPRLDQDVIDAMLDIVKKKQLPITTKHFEMALALDVRYVAALVIGMRRCPSSKTDAILRVFFAALQEASSSSGDILAALEVLCSDEDAARVALPMWARSGAKMFPTNETTLASSLGALGGLAKAANGRYTDIFIQLASGLAFLRTLKSGLNSTSRVVATATATLIVDLARVDTMLAQQLLVCGGGIVNYIWDGVRNSCRRGDDSDDVAPFVSALAALATAAPTSFFSGALDTTPLLFEIIATDTIDAPASAFHLLSLRMAHCDEDATSLAATVFKLVGPRLALEGNRPVAPSLRAAEWRAFRVAVAVLNDLSEEAIKVIVLAASRGASQVQQQQQITGGMTHTATAASMTERRTTTPQGWWRGHVEPWCPCCEFIRSVLEIARIVDTKDEMKQRLAAVLVVLVPVYVYEFSSQTACSTLFAQLMTTVLRWTTTPRLRRILFDAGAPHAVLTSVAAAVGPQKTATFAEAYMLLYGHDLLEEDKEDWAFVLAWFAVEVKAYQMQYGIPEVGMKAVVHVASEILTDIPNQRLSFAWAASRRKCAALLLVETCAGGGIDDDEGTTTTRSLEVVGSSAAALDALLRSSTFSALLDSGELDEAPSIFALLKLIAAANGTTLPRNLGDRISAEIKFKILSFVGLHFLFSDLVCVVCSRSCDHSCRDEKFLIFFFFFLNF